MTKHRVKDLPHGQECAVKAALAHRDDPLEVIRRIADEHDHMLAGGGSDLAHRDGGDVGGGPKARWKRLGSG